MDIQKVTYEDSETNQKVEELIEDPSKGEYIKTSCNPITVCCPDTGWR